MRRGGVKNYQYFIHMGTTITTTRWVSCQEHRELTIAKGEEILSANYGDPKYGGFDRIQGADVTIAARKRAKKSLILKARNDWWGDPRAGVLKKLSVLVSASPVHSFTVTERQGAMQLPTELKQSPFLTERLAHACYGDSKKGWMDVTDKARQLLREQKSLEGISQSM